MSENMIAGKHTARPWHAYPKQSDGFVPIVASAGNCPDAVIAVVGYDCPEDRIEANARLMAAAPMLLDLLNRLQIQANHANTIQLSGVPIGPSIWADIYQTCEEARAAIAKATGGAS